MGPGCLLLPHQRLRLLRGAQQPEQWRWAVLSLRIGHEHGRRRSLGRAGSYAGILPAAQPHEQPCPDESAADQRRPQPECRLRFPGPYQHHSPGLGADQPDEQPAWCAYQPEPAGQSHAALRSESRRRPGHRSEPDPLRLHCRHRYESTAPSYARLDRPARQPRREPQARQQSRPRRHQPGHGRGLPRQRFPRRTAVSARPGTPTHRPTWTW